MPPLARWAELSAGKEGVEGSSSSWSAPRENVGIVGDVIVADVFGVVGEADLTLNGGGGGGIALRSSSCLMASFLGASSRTMIFSSLHPPESVDISKVGGGVGDGASWIRSFCVTSWRGVEGRRSHDSNDHVNGEWR